MKIYLFLLLTLLASSPAHAQIRAEWELVYDIEEPFYIIKSDGVDLYAAGNNGIHVSRTGGNTWHYRDLCRGLEKVRVLTMASGGGVYIGTAHHGIWRSVDRGNIWQPKNKGMTHFPGGTPEYLWMEQILVTDSDAVIAVGYHSGTWISQDRGDSWTDVTAQWTVPREGGSARFPIRRRIWSMTEFDGYLWAVYAGYPLYRSRDEGGSWEIVYSNIDNFDRVKDWAVLDNTLYVAGSTNFGRWNEAEQRWELLNRGLPVHRGGGIGRWDLAVNRGRIFAAPFLYDRGVWLFDQSSETWVLVGPQNTGHMYSICTPPVNWVSTALGSPPFNPTTNSPSPGAPLKQNEGNHS